MTAFGFGVMKTRPDGGGQVTCTECGLHMDVTRLTQLERAIIEAAVWEYEAGLASPHLHKAVEASEKEKG